MKRLVEAATKTAALQALSCLPKWSLIEKAVMDQTLHGISLHPMSG